LDTSEGRFQVADGETIPDAFSFHFEGSVLPPFGPLEKLARMFDSGKHLIMSERITSDRQPDMVTYAKWHPHRCW
jgi:hypothetical protein